MNRIIWAAALVCASVSLAAENPAVVKAGRALTLNASPLSFEPNLGQGPSQARFMTRSSGYTLQLEPAGARFELAGPNKESKAVELKFDHANPAAAIYGDLLLPGKANYFPASDSKTWITGVPTYSRVRYASVYPGVDVAFYGNAKKLEYDFILQPGADPERIQLSLRGIERSRLNSDGDLVFGLGEREMSFLKPVIYQMASDGKTRRQVEGHYIVDRDRAGKAESVRFAMGKYDRTRTLVIDPAVSLTYSEYLDYHAGSVAVDSAGNTYVGGPLGNSSGALYLTKFSPTGAIVYNNYFGSGGNAWVYGVAVDSTGKAYVAGQVYTGDVMPISTNAYSGANTAAYSAFLTVFSAAGSAVTYCSYLGGVHDSSSSWAAGVAVDASGKAYLTGRTNSLTFPLTAGAFQTAHAAPSSWVAKFDPAQTTAAATLVYSTLLGPTGTAVSGIAVDNAGSAYVTGNAPSGYPITSGAFRYAGYHTSYGGVFATKLNPAGSAPVYSAYLGDGIGYGIAVEGQANPSAYVTGTVGFADFPTTAGAYQTSYAGGFLTKLSGDGASEVYSTFLGGPSSFDGTGVTPYSVALPYGCVSSCNAYVAGWTKTSDFPAINAIQAIPSTDASYTAFAVEVAPTGQSALFSSYLSGLRSGVASNAFDSWGKAPALAVDSSGNISLIGNIDANYNDFPLSITNANGAYGFLAKISPAATGTTFVSPTAINFGNQPVGVSTSVYNGTATVIVRNVSSNPATLTQPVQVSPSTVFTESDNCGGVIPAAGSCTLNLDFTPAAAGVRTGTVTITTTASNSPSVVALTGTGIDTAFLQTTQASLSFGDVAVGGGSATQSITLTNSSDITTAPSFTLGTSDFSQLSNCPGQLAPRASCTVNVTFKPTQTGLRKDSLLIYSSMGPNTSVSLTGNGIVSGGSSAVSLSAVAVDFGTQIVTTSSGAQIVYLTNNGAAPVSIQSLAVSGDFSIYTSTCPASQVNPQSYCSAYITFSPTTAGLRTGTLSFNDNATGSPHTVSLSGTGLASTGDVDLYPAASVAFPDTAVGVLSGTTQTIYLENSGTAPVTVDRVLMTGDFHLSNDSCTARVVAGNAADGVTPTYYYCSVSVSFTPTSAGARTGSLTFVDSAPGSPHVVTLTGNGGAPSGSIALNPTVFDFSTQPQGTTSAYTSIGVVNPGNTPVTVTGFSFTGDYSLNYSNCGTPPFSVAPGYGSCYLRVQFTPTATGARTGSVTIASSAGNQTATLNGTGLAATQSIGLTPTAMNLGSIVTGVAGAYEPVYVRNTGNQTVTFTVNPVVSGPNAGDFTLSLPTCANTNNTLAAGSSCSFSVRFTPTAAGTRSATLTLTDSAGIQTLALTGTGVASIPTVTFSDYLVSFNTQLVSTTSPVNTYIYFYNNGAGALPLGNATVTGNFLITHGDDSCSGQTVAAHGRCAVYVQFAPAAAGYLTGSLTFNSSAGTALSGVPSVPLAGYAAALTYSSYAAPTATNFTSQQVVGTTSPYQRVYLYNTGDSPLRVGTIAGTNVGLAGATFEFSVYAANSGYDGCSGQTVLAGSSCYLNVTFTPNAPGPRSGSLSFPITYANNSTATVAAAVTGTAVSEKDSAVANPSVVSFVDQSVGTTSSYNTTVFLTNSGNLPFTVNTLSGVNTVVGSSGTGEFSTAPAAGGRDGCSGATVQPGGYCYLYVTFTPAAAGTRTGSINFPVTFASHATINTKIGLTGIGVASAKTLQITPGSMQFPAQLQTVVSGYQVVSITNTGNVPIHIASDLISTNSSEFAISSDSCANVNLAYKQGCSIRITFKPLADSIGTRTGILTIGDNATGGPHSVALSGTAINASQSIVLSQHSVTFGNQPAGSSSSIQYVYATNQTDSTIPITSIVLAGTNAGDFKETTTCPSGGSSLGARKTCSIAITFAPAASVTGVRTASVTESDVAAGSPRVITITGNAIVPGPALALTPATFNFGTMNVGISSAPQNFSVTNTGSTNLILASVAATNPQEFPLTSDGCAGATLTPGQRCVFSAKFAPSLGGARTGTISITDNAAGSPHALALTGTGYGIPVASLTPTSLTFANQNIGAAGPSQAVTLKNPGTDKLVVSGITVTGVNAADYTQTNNCPANLAPAALCTITVAFKPSAAGARGAAVTITDNANNAGGSAQNVTLAGTGVAVPTGSVSPATLTFPATNSGATSIAMSASLSNAGTGPLTVTGIVIGGVNASDFTLVNNCGSTLIAGASCAIMARFTPSAPGTRTATITVTDNANNVAGSTQTVALTGTGAGLPAASLSASFLGYTDQNVGTNSATQTVTLSNTGAGTLTIATIALTGANPADFVQTKTCGATLAAATSCTISVAFQPAAVGARQASLVVTDNSGGVAGSIQTVALFGVGH